MFRRQQGPETGLSCGLISTCRRYWISYTSTALKCFTFVGSIFGRKTPLSPRYFTIVSEIATASAPESSLAKMLAVEFGHRGLARTRSGAKFGLRLNCLVSVLGEEALNRLEEVPLAEDGVGSPMSMGSLNLCFEVSCASRVERSQEDSATG